MSREPPQSKSMETQRRLRTADPLAGFGSVWNLPEPLSASPSLSPRPSPLGLSIPRNSHRRPGESQRDSVSKPRVASSELPWEREAAAANPNGVAASGPRLKPQPRWGCSLLAQFTEGSSLLATLGWRTQSLRDWAGIGKLVGNAQPLGRGRAPRCDQSRRAGISSDGRHGTLSFGERAGVRGNRAHLDSAVSGGLRLGRFNAEAQRNAEKRREEELSASLCESLRFPGGREQRASGSPSPPWEETGVWTSSAELTGRGQPVGLPEGSRWSFPFRPERPPDSRVRERAPRRGARAAQWPPRTGSESGLAPCQGAGHLLRRYPEVAAPQNPPATSGYPLSTLRVDQRAAESRRGFLFSAFLGGSLRLCVDCSFQDEPKNSSRLNTKSTARQSRNRRRADILVNRCQFYLS